MIWRIKVKLDGFCDQFGSQGDFNCNRQLHPILFHDDLADESPANRSVAKSESCHTLNVIVGSCGRDEQLVHVFA